jgi:hypothetical protein
MSQGTEGNKPSEETSSDIQEKHATVKVAGPKTAKEKPKQTPAKES